MRIRKQNYGTCNIVGKNIEYSRKCRGIKQKDFISKLQTMGVDINPSSYSKIEGQVRVVTDVELYAIAKVLDVSIDSLFEASINKDVV